MAAPVQNEEKDEKKEPEKKEPEKKEPEKAWHGMILENRIPPKSMIYHDLSLSFLLNCHFMGITPICMF